MKIVDRYWTNHDAPDMVDRNTEPPLLNFDLIRKINGRSGEDPEPFEWKGKIVKIDKKLMESEPVGSNINPGENEFHSSASSLAQIYHKWSLCCPGKTYSCKVNAYGKSLQIFNCTNPPKQESQSGCFNHSMNFGIAIDTLFTMTGSVDEHTDALIDKLAYFCVFQREFQGYKLNIRKEIDIMLQLQKSYLPIELKTRTWLGMNKRALFYQLLPTLITRSWLTGCYTVVIAVRDQDDDSCISKVLFIEDIRDIAWKQFQHRAKYFKYLLHKLHNNRQQLTEIEYSKDRITLKSNEQIIVTNLDSDFIPLLPRIDMDTIKPDFILCLDSELDNLTPTISDVVNLRKWILEKSWHLANAGPLVYIAAWHFETLLEFLGRHEERDDDLHNTITVFLPNNDDIPCDEEVEFAVVAAIGNNVIVHVKLYEDLEDLEQHLEDLEFYENCGHSMVLLGHDVRLPSNYALRGTDVFRLETFPRIQILRSVTMPEKIAVFGTGKECCIAREKLSKLEMFEGFEDYTYFYILDVETFVPTIRFKHMHFVTPYTDIVDLLRLDGLPYAI